MTMDAIVPALCFGAIIVWIGAFWQIFVKAGKPGWAILIPFYNLYVLLEVAEKPGWWLILMFIPIVNVVISICMYIGLAEAFGKGVGFTIGLVLLPLIFVPILGFSNAKYGYRNDNWRQGIIESDKDVSGIGSPLRFAK
jgi:hypothetical protein